VARGTSRRRIEQKDHTLGGHTHDNDHATPRPPPSTSRACPACRQPVHVVRAVSPLNWVHSTRRTA
jgi:hypothetical protein